MSSRSIAVLMTCHNRRDTTLACLESLYAAGAALTLDVFLVDDGSTDGTTAAVSARFPSVHVLPGSGELYWVGGMRLAYDHAIATPHDFILWLNDDVVLAPSALVTLVDTWNALATSGHARSIVVGAVTDPNSGHTSYSGVARTQRSRPTRFSRVEPGPEPRQCDTFNGNVALIPEEVRRAVGNVDGAFVHRMADFDYGLRARALGCEIWLAPGAVGTCQRTEVAETGGATAGRAFAERLRLVCEPKGLPPRSWRVFTSRHAGWCWPAFWISPYVRALLGSKRQDDEP